MGSVRDKVVVVTGASSGIGRAAALRFAHEGAAVVLAARREDALAEVERECRGAGAQALAVPTDVADEREVYELAQRAIATFGRIDVWVNNAAVSLFSRFAEAPPDLFRKVVETNLFGYVHGARAALPIFHEQGGGTLINVSSVFGRIGAPFLSAYVTTKYAILGFTESLRAELRDDGISVCAILPASIDTPIFENAANLTGRKVKPLPPVEPPEKVAAAIVRCAKRPRRGQVVGRGGRRMLLFRRLFGALAERRIARKVAREHFDQWPASPSEGNVFEPSAAKAAAGGGWRGDLRAPRRVQWALGATAAALVGTGLWVRGARA